MDLDGKQTISLRASCFLPPAPTHLSQTVIWEARFPLSRSPLSTLPAGGAGGEAGEARARAPARLIRRNPRHERPSSPAALSVPVLQVVPAAPRSVTPHVPECACQHPVVFPCPAWLPASPSPCPSALHSCPHSCSLEQKQPLVFPPLLRSIRLPALGVSRGACVGVRFVWGSSVPPTLSRMACDAAGPSGHLGHVCELVTPLPAAAGGLLLSVHCPAVSLSVSPLHPRPMAGGAQCSSGLDQNGGPSC